MIMMNTTRIIVMNTMRQFNKNEIRIGVPLALSNDDFGDTFCLTAIDSAGNHFLENILPGCSLRRRVSLFEAKFSPLSVSPYQIVEKYIKESVIALQLGLTISFSISTGTKLLYQSEVLINLSIPG